MPPRYSYSGDEPTVFISLQQDGETWVPNHGDEIELDEPVTHPLLELIIATKKKPASEAETETQAAIEVEPESNKTSVATLDPEEK